ncbi:hypothetical protein [Moorena bouillonii]|uniref:Uncharacterized protein n=1 Tax=Moorena bouillonii PNG TaxID=568701 RepID=A0A1U7MWR4_9CYAN|nr:hypothetical protein [Moorena bouillonii]OLT58081.1 hypothetical protein BJP37_02505 [Moorena bouillonii PNG]
MLSNISPAASGTDCPNTAYREIAMVHLLYNVLGVIIIYGIPFLCRLPIISAETLPAVASERKAIAFAYILGVFFVIPGILLGVTVVL